MKKIDSHIFCLHHDVRRPLSNMVTITDMIRSKKLDEEAAENFDKMLKHSLKEFDEALQKYESIVDDNKSISNTRLGDQLAYSLKQVYNYSLNFIGVLV